MDRRPRRQGLDGDTPLMRGLLAPPRASLLVAILGSTMAFLDGTVINVALPVMQSALGATVVEMQWIVEAYALLLAALLLVGGALGDRLGRKRVFLAGVIVFAVASAACGAAPSTTLLIAARGVQGIGGALLVPGSLALISAAYSEDERGRAIGIWSAASAITTSLGPVAGGWVVAHMSWRWLFYFNVPIALVVLIAARGVHETRDETAPSQIDVLGAALAVLGLGVIVFALLDAPNASGHAHANAQGITHPRSLGLLAIGVLMLIAFGVVEAKTKYPMMPLSLFKSRTFVGTNLLTLTVYASLGGSLFFVPFDLVQVQGYSAAQAGAALLPLVVIISVLSPLAGAFTKRRGARIPLIVGPLVVAVGYLLLALLPSSSPGAGATGVGAYWTTFFPGLVVLGLGMGITVAPLTTAVMGSVGEDHAGVASGINNAVSRTAGLLAVAGLGLVLMSRFDRTLASALDAMAAPDGVRHAIEAQRAKLASADLNAIEPQVWRTNVRQALLDAYSAGFRLLMFVCTALAALGSLFAAIYVEPQDPKKKPD